MRPRVGISLGDITGVGPEVSVKALVALAAEQVPAEFTLIGDAGIVGSWIQRLGHDLESFRNLHLLDPSREPLAVGGGSPRSQGAHVEGRRRTPAAATPAFGAQSPASAEPLSWDLPPGAPTAARAAVLWIREGARLCLGGELDALVTAPVNKHAIVEAGLPFVGHTELLSEIAGEPRTIMMLLGPDERDRWLRVALATVHVPLREVPLRLTQDKVLLAIERTAQACNDLGLSRGRIGVCGLNPHAGEGGEFGDDEVRIIEPAIQRARDQGLDVIGPLSGDTVFHQALDGEFDAVVAMYHDQGLAPLKLVAFHTGVNWTLGLPFIRTSPDHGTAYNIAGKGIANPSSMISAIRLAVQLAVRKAG